MISLMYSAGRNTSSDTGLCDVIRHYILLVDIYYIKFSRLSIQMKFPNLEYDRFLMNDTRALEFPIACNICEN